MKALEQNQVWKVVGKMVAGNPWALEVEELMIGTLGHQRTFGETSPVGLMESSDSNETAIAVAMKTVAFGFAAASDFVVAVDFAAEVDCCAVAVVGFVAAAGSGFAVGFDLSFEFVL